MVFLFPTAMDLVELEDWSFSLYSPGRSPVSMSQGGRPVVLSERLRDATGAVLPVQKTGSGLWVVDLKGGQSLEVERLLRVPDRSSGEREHHPYGSSVEADQAVFYGADVLLGLRSPRAGDGGRVALALEAPPEWKVFTPWGDARQLEVDSASSLRNNFFMLGRDLEACRQTVSGCEFVVVSPLRLTYLLGFDPCREVLRLARLAVAELGAPSAARVWLFLKPLEHTEHLRKLSLRGASAAQSALVHIDPRTPDAYEEHPLSVAAHELFHLWVPQSLRIAKELPAWTREGLATYYENLWLLQTGLTARRQFLQAMLDAWFLSRGTLPGSVAVSLEQASQNFERHSLAMDLVYRRGSLAAFGVDFLLREASEGREGLVDIVRELRELPSGTAFESDPIGDALAARDPAKYRRLRAWLRSSAPPPIEGMLAALGYRIEDRRLPYLGIRFAAKERPTVASIGPGSPVAAVLEEGDVIQAIGEHAVHSLADFRVAFASLASGEEIGFEVERSGAAVKIRVTPGSRRAPTVVADEELPESVRQRREWFFGSRASAVDPPR